jgi:hypothetical protein
MPHKVDLSTLVATVLVRSGLISPCAGLNDGTSDAKPGVDAKTAFAKIKPMVEDWTNAIPDREKVEKSKGGEGHQAGEAAINYRLTRAGSALVETQFPGEAHEMVSVYHVDREDVRMTHFCAAGNQPRLKLDKARSTPDHLIFVIDGGLWRFNASGTKRGQSQETASRSPGVALVDAV